MRKGRRASLPENEESEYNQNQKSKSLLSYSSMPNMDISDDLPSEYMQWQARPWQAQESMLTPDDHIIWQVFPIDLPYTFTGFNILFLRAIRSERHAEMIRIRARNQAKEGKASSETLPSDSADSISLESMWCQISLDGEAVEPALCDYHDILCQQGPFPPKFSDSASSAKDCQKQEERSKEPRHLEVGTSP